MLGGSLGVRLSFTLAVHLCVAVHHRPHSATGGSGEAPASGSIGGGHHAGAAAKEHDPASASWEVPHTRPPLLLLLLAYPSQVVHFLSFGVFSAEAPTGPPGSRATSGGARGAARVAGGGPSGKATGAAVFVEPTVLLPARVAFCAFLDLIILRCCQQEAEPQGMEGGGGGQCSTAATGQAFIDDVALRLLDIVRGAGPYAWVASREAGQASWLNSCKVQAWQALCLLCRGLSKAAAEKVRGVRGRLAGSTAARRRRDRP